MLIADGMAFATPAVGNRDLGDGDMAGTGLGAGIATGKTLALRK